MRAAFGIIPLVLLAACGSGGEGTAIAINVNDPGGNFAASTSKDGSVAIKAPGFDGKINLPKIQIDAGDFDIDGVQLPAGSKIANLDINGSPGDDKVRVTFTSPVAPAAVVEHFRSRLAEKGFKLTAAGARLSGTTDEGKPFALDAKPAGSGSESVLTIS